jgi:cbb3-type cytochrome oxidase maturation protein
MDILVMMILISLGLSVSFVFAFWWANKGRQFDDLVTPALRAVFEDNYKEKDSHGDKNG